MERERVGDKIVIRERLIEGEQLSFTLTNITIPLRYINAIQVD